MEEGHILTIAGREPTEQEFLPLDTHPYDHFLIQAILARSNKIEWLSFKSTKESTLIILINLFLQILLS